MVPATGLLLLELPPPSSSTNFGNYKASSQTFRARTVVGDVPIGRLRSSGLLQLEAHFLGITSWAGQRTIEYEQTRDSTGRVQTLDVHLREIAARSVRLAGGLQLTLSGTWDVPGGHDESAIYAPITISCESKRPVKDVSNLLAPLLRVQDLLNFAYDGFVKASGGGANLDLEPAEHAEYEPPIRPMWNGALMRALPAVEDIKLTRIPTFSLAGLQGLPGLARWIRLTQTHPRATTVVTDRYRMGHTGAADSIRAAANGIEYWVSTHHRTTQWANLPKDTNKPSPVKALARRVGRPFSDWVGDPDKWAEEFWDTYNKLKHDVAYVVKTGDVADLATSGRLLLAAELLNRSATTKLPSKQLLGSSRYY